MDNMPTQELEALRFIRYEAQDAIGYITLNRPEKRNALSADMVTELKQAFEFAEDDEACKVIVLRAEGGAFCAGADLAYIQELQGFGYTDNLADSTHLMQLFHQIYTLKKVVIAQVQGHALAGGCGLAALCDFAFAVPEAKFGFTEVKIGFLPAIVSVFLIRKIGEARTKQLLLTGDIISAQKALDIHLVNEVVPAETLAAHVYAFARRLCVENSAQSMEVTKEMLARLPEMPLEDSLRYAAQLNAEARGTLDCRRGIAAFLAKEKISWEN
ncbi:enoyl-CoA hydratase/isomerase family protein [Hymenobacter sp. BT186]|uniref:Enoyl-CoA hydratase/isomerase family protein n=1 Tax=Hymenobacter telluris TaxID=2816474 RepID=A0A939F0Q7_9BACT|nr:enoyl-CoA hydratase/isomerase family protein [Hymenobacter telluris]MBO0360632.1 enoyl-CoA hydratase/isomerase family protein [Hymenobacter telluris]MBW3376659.1 enoyl-CoA hydratase/isomerase family protein [Hymenobacter norwichensis]